MKDLIKKYLDEALILKVNNDKQELVVFSNEKDAKKASTETFKNKEKLKANKLFNWDGDIKAWVTPITNFEQAKAVLNEINKTSEFVGKVEDLEAFVRNSEDFDGKGNLMDKLSLYVQDLANTTDEKAMSAEIRRYLTFFASFKGHSFFNTMLIFIQKPDASKVAGFRQWETKYFRRVKKGAKGIMIFAPVFNKKDGEIQTDNSELDKEVGKGNPIRFRPVYVFDISDTEAIDERGNAPEPISWFSESEPTERTKQLYGYLKQVAEALGINVTANDSTRGERGYSAGNHINMTSTVEGAGEVSTLVHELAHELMHWKKSSLYYQGDEIKNDPSIKELQAESVAYVVMKHFGLPVEHQPTYIALWRGNKEKILANLKVISNVAKFIIDEVDKFASEKNIDENLYF
jgi:hypothetical protein